MAASASMKAAEPITEQQLREMFDQNFERLRLENGHSLAPDVKDVAWEQIRMYWRKLRPIAESVTDTEVKLNLPNQVTRKKRNFCIEGIVDIVRDGKKVTMYDLKTHDVEFVETHIELYSDQLNVYAYIWQNLRGEELDETAVIATQVPDEVTAALRSGNSVAIEQALSNWNPVVPIKFDGAKVNKTISQFAEAVDAIEDREFSARTIDALREREGKRGTFATRVCRNCDVRFSCGSYRSYAVKFADRGWTKFANFYDIASDEAETLARFRATAEDTSGVGDFLVQVD
jgi:hypothetical protein